MSNYWHQEGRCRCWRRCALPRCALCLRWREGISDNVGRPRSRSLRKHERRYRTLGGGIRAERTTNDGEISGASSSGIRDAKPTPDAARITASERSAEPFENAAVLASHAVAASDKNADRLRRRTILLANAPTLPVVGGGASIGSPLGSACHAGAQKASLATTQTSAP
jgi:hypothetical protein